MFKLFKKPIIIGKVYTISDLNTPNNAFSLIDIKSKIRILIIDDEEFVYKEPLREENYNIKCVTNIDDLCAVSEYPIVICDIKGVGTNFSKEKEGAYVVSELKKKYPFKQIAVYSGLDYKLDSLNDLDGIIRVKKDVSIDTWRDSLNELIRRASDPKENWKTIRNFLLNNDVSIKDVLILESNFVDIYINRPNDMKYFPEDNIFPNISQDIKSIIQNMIAGGLLQIISISNVK